MSTKPHNMGGDSGADPACSCRFHLNLRNRLIYPLTEATPRWWPGAAALLVCWQVTNLAGFTAESVRVLPAVKQSVSPVG